MNNKIKFGSQGFASVVLLAAAIIILIVGIGLYGYFQSTGDDNIIHNFMSPPTEQEVNMEAETEISESDEVETLEAEMETTVVGSPDDELQELEQGAEEL